jgi:hypothetical protein
MLRRWVRRRKLADQQDSGSLLQASGGVAFDADLLATLPRGLLRALPGVSPAVLFTAYSQARNGKASRDLMRMFGLSLHDAKTVLAYSMEYSGE